MAGRCAPRPALLRRFMSGLVRAWEDGVWASGCDIDRLVAECGGQATEGFKETALSACCRVLQGTWALAACPRNRQGKSPATTKGYGTKSLLTKIVLQEASSPKRTSFVCPSEPATSPILPTTSDSGSAETRSVSITSGNIPRAKTMERERPVQTGTAPTNKCSTATGRRWHSSRWMP